MPTSTFKHIARSSQIFTYRVVYTLHVSAIEISWAAVWAVTHPDVGDAVVLAPVSEDLRADVHVRHHLARPLHDHHLDEPALVEVSVETAVPLRVDCLLALHVLHADVCKRRESVRTCSVSRVAGLPCWKSTGGWRRRNNQSIYITPYVPGWLHVRRAFFYTRIYRIRPN